MLISLIMTAFSSLNMSSSSAQGPRHAGQQAGPVSMQGSRQAQSAGRQPGRQGGSTVSSQAACCLPSLHPPTAFSRHPLTPVSLEVLEIFEQLFPVVVQNVHYGLGLAGVGHKHLNTDRSGHGQACAFATGVQCLLLPRRSCMHVAGTHGP